MDNAATSVSGADFEQGPGAVHVEGTITLNYTAVRCFAAIGLVTLSGTGCLVD